MKDKETTVTNNSYHKDGTEVRKASSILLVKPIFLFQVNEFSGGIAQMKQQIGHG